jgi:hypothetical protein
LFAFRFHVIKIRKCNSISATGLKPAAAKLYFHTVYTVYLGSDPDLLV